MCELINKICDWTNYTLFLFFFVVLLVIQVHVPDYVSFSIILEIISKEN